MKLRNAASRPVDERPTAVAMELRADRFAAMTAAPFTIAP